MVEIVNSEIKLTIKEIESVEHFVGLEFPMEYKSHLLKYNGGQVKPNVFKFKENGIVNNSILDWFLAIYDGEYDNLKRYIEIYKIEEQRLPIQLIPIAHDPAGNLICISCGGSDAGFIYFWDHENEVELSGTNYSNLYLIAKGFNDFISGLTDF